MIVKNSELALTGGEKLINRPFKRYNSIGEEEKIAATKVLESGILSNF